MGHVDGIEFFRQRRYLFDELHIVIAVVVGTCGEFVVDAVNLRLHLMQMGERLAGFLEHGSSVFGHEVLRQIGDDTVFRCGNRATSGSSHASYNFEQCTLTCAILSHQCYTVLLVDLEGNVFE